MKLEADQPCGLVDLSNQDQSNNVCILAKALVFARTGQTSYRTDVVAAISAIVNSAPYNGRALALGRELGAYVIAADLIDLKTFDPTLDTLFRTKIQVLLTTPTLSGPANLIDCHEDRPNNWGTHCGGARAAVAAYLGDSAELARVAQVFKGWLGDRSSYAGFSYGELSWQCNASAPVGINPKGCTKSGQSIDGVLPDDQRRGGIFTWPPPKENYVYEALQGALLQAVILHRAGYDAFNWEDKALLRAFDWLHTQANYPADGDDTWLPHLINHYYGTSFPAPVPSSPGKNMGWTDWTHSGTLAQLPVLNVSPTALSFSGTEGGANPAAQALQISNAGGGTLNWTASTTQTWLTLTPLSGSGSATVSVSASISGLLAGNYTGTITITSSNAQGSPVQVGVTLTLNPPPQSATAVSFNPNPVIGGSSSTGTVTISSPAPSGGKAVGLSSNNALVSVPATVTVAAGSTTANFAATTGAVTQRQQVTITATLNGSMQAVLIVDPPADTTPPVITAVVAGSITSSGATITWATNEASDTQVNFGLTTAYGSSSPLDASQMTSHSVALSGLQAGTLYHYRVRSRDAAGNLAVSGDFTFATQAPAASSCKTSSSSSWQNTAFTPQTGTFTAEFDATPNAANMDGVTGVSAGLASRYSSLAAITRFNRSGKIDARNGGSYTAVTAIPYTAGATYHFRLVIRVASRTYDVYVTPPGSTEKALGLNYAFRSEQATVSSLGNWALHAAVGTHKVCNFQLR